MTESRQPEVRYYGADVRVSGSPLYLWLGSRSIAWSPGGAWVPRDAVPMEITGWLMAYSPPWGHMTLRRRVGRPGVWSIRVGGGYILLMGKGGRSLMLGGVVG